MQNELVFTSKQISINNEVKSYYEFGSGNKNIICLHGFPDHPKTFYNQIKMLIELGYRVFLPYMRGYTTEKDKEDINISACDIQLGYDLLNFIDALHIEKTDIIAHDWGCIGAYAALNINSTVFNKVIVISIPYGDAFFRSLLINQNQQQKSWYSFILGSSISEILLLQNNLQFIETLWSLWTEEKYTIAETEIQEIKTLIRRNCKKVIEYYRNIFINNNTNFDTALIKNYGKIKILTPTLYIHGVNDNCIVIETARMLNKKLFNQLFYHEINNTNHFPHRENHEIINPLIVNFLNDV